MLARFSRSHGPPTLEIVGQQPPRMRYLQMKRDDITCPTAAESTIGRAGCTTSFLFLFYQRLPDRGGMEFARLMKMKKHRKSLLLRRLLFLALPEFQLLLPRLRHKPRILHHLNLSLHEPLLRLDLFETADFILNLLLFRTLLPQLLLCALLGQLVSFPIVKICSRL